MAEIKINDYVSGFAAVTEEESNKVYNTIRYCLCFSIDKEITINFDLIQQVSRDFLKNTFGKIYDEFDFDMLMDRLNIINIKSDVQANLNDIINWRMREKKRKSFYKVYISGKIDGLTEEECHLLFNKAADAAREMFSDKEVYIVNPFEQPRIQSCWADYIIRDLIMLKECDCILMMPNSKDSYGAKIELLFAEKLGLNIIELPNL